jgi:hypothetical protein
MPQTGGSDSMDPGLPPVLTKPGVSQGPQPAPNIIVSKPPNHGGGQNPEYPGPRQPGGNVIPWPGGPFNPPHAGPQLPQRGPRAF